MDDVFGVRLKIAVHTEPALSDDEEPQLSPADAPVESPAAGISPFLLENIKSVLLYMDKLLEALPEAKVTEFANSDFFKTYKSLFTELGLV
jgi:hypothetical protein